MSQLAKEILKKAKKEKATFVDLGNCGLKGKLPAELFDEYFIKNLEGLSLGSYYRRNSKDDYLHTQNKGERNCFKGYELNLLSKLKRLTSLIITFDYDDPGTLESMSFLNKCIHLLELNLTGNQISKIEGLNENLQTLELIGNQIKRIEGLNENLQTLILYNNQINKIEGLNKNLKILDLSFNRISKIEGLNENLKELDLSHNSIEDVSPLAEMSNLNKINLNNNKIENLSSLFGKIINGMNFSVNIYETNDQEISIGQNPITTPPIEIIKRGRELLLRFIEENQRTTETKLEISNIFLSYCHKNNDIANSIDIDFQRIGIALKRDVRDVGYLRSIKKFMKQIRNSGYALMIISDEFLKSENCMYEATEFLKEINVQDRILLIVLENSQIYNLHGKIMYVKYWKEKFELLNNALNELPRDKSVDLSEDLRKVENIYSHIGEFLSVISDRKSVPLSDLKKNNYKEILDIIGFDKNELQVENILKDEKPPVKEIKIFLASSTEMKSERDQFRIFLSTENNRYIRKGIYLSIIVWEDFLDAMSPTRLQDEYNKAAEECDVFVMLYFTKVGKYTTEEFEKAFKHFRESNKPRIFTYFKNADVKMGDIDESCYLSLKAFQKKLIELGHFQTEFDNNEKLHLHFKRQLEILYDL